MRALLAALIILPIFAACESDPEALRPGDTHLRRLSSCVEMEEAFTREVGISFGRGTETDVSFAPLADAAEASENSVAGETNVQVVGVDELDSMKADGDFIYRFQGNELIVLRRSPADQAGVIQTVELSEGPFPISPELSFPYYVGTGQTGLFLTSQKLMVIDSDSRGVLLHVFNRASDGTLSLYQRRGIDGYLMGARMIGEQVHLFTSKGVRPYILEAEVLGAPEPLSVDSLRAHSSSEDIEVQDLLQKTRFVANETTLADCTDIYIEPAIIERDEEDPVFWDAPSNLVCVSAVHIGRLDSLPEAECVAASSYSQIYVSATNAYLASGGWSSDTPIHQFSISNEPSYVGTVNVPGYLNNQFSMDERDGYFRVATTYREQDQNGDVVWSSLEENGLFVYELVQGDPELMGEVKGFGEGERIYAVRFMQDKAFVVTFRQTDPLFAIDLSDPTNPVLKGELEIPGFSTYLHPMEEGYLLSIGQDGDAQGTTSQVALSIFDVRDLEDPQLLHRESIGTDYSSSEAMYDHHAFRYIAENGLLVLPVATYEGWSDWEEGFQIYETNVANGFSLVGESPFAGTSSYTWYGAEARSFFRDGVIAMVGGGELVLRSASEPSVDLARVDAQ